MASAGGHWTKVQAGHLEGKRMFVPGGWSDQDAYFAYNNNVTPGTMSADLKYKYFGNPFYGGMPPGKPKQAAKPKAKQEADAKPAVKAKASAPDLFSVGAGQAAKPAKVTKAAGAKPKTTKGEPVTEWKAGKIGTFPTSIMYATPAKVVSGLKPGQTLTMQNGVKIYKPLIKIKAKYWVREPGVNGISKMISNAQDAWEFGIGIQTGQKLSSTITITIE